MMKSHMQSGQPARWLLLLTFISAFSCTAQAGVSVAQPAPDFTGIDSNGGTHSLNQYRGKTVVLEWTNHDCPYVRKHYQSGNMQKLQKAATSDGIVWLSIISSAPGKQGHVSGAEANALTSQRNASPSAVILDEKGDIGRLYGAKTTPHMYMGGIDNIPSSNQADIDRATNYVSAALQSLKEGKVITDNVTRPYGCSVKYD